MLMFAWCCADQSPGSKNVRPVEKGDDAEDAELEVNEEDSQISKVSVTQVPALPEEVVRDFLPDTLEVDEQRDCKDQAEVETQPHTLDSLVSASTAEAMLEGVGSMPAGRRTRLQKQAVASHWKLESSEMEMTKELSRTLKSTLYLATWRGTEVVMKCVQMPDDIQGQKRSSSKESITASRPMQGNDVDKSLLEELLHEIELLSTLRHPDLVMFLGACLDKDSPVMCITEYMPGGDLERYYLARRNQAQTDRWRPPLPQVLDWSSAVARALSFLHSRPEPIVHRDMKPLNLLLTKHLEVKVADLGISKMMAAVASDVYNMTGGVGSWLYMAPEVVRHKDYNEKVDIYAFGLIMYFMSAGKAPFYQMGKDPELVLKEYQKGNEPRPTQQDCYKELRPIMTAAWAVDHKQRPSAEALVQRLGHARADYAPPSCMCARP